MSSSYCPSGIPTRKLAPTIQSDEWSRNSWSVHAGAKDAHKLLVEIELWDNRDGSLMKADYTPKTKIKMGTNSFYRAASEAEMRAVNMPDCNPLKGLPQDK